MKIKELICFFFILMLSGCASTSKFHYDIETLKKEVISAEIIEVTDTEVDKDIKINSLYIIGENELENMLSDLSNLKIVVTKGRPQRAKGECIKLNYANEYELICDTIIIKNDNENNEIYHKDIYKPKGFDGLISNYKKK